MQDADTPVVDDGLDQAMASIAPEPAHAGDEGAAEEKATGGDERPRDEQGRFAKAEAKEEASQEQPKGGDGEDRDGGQIPSWRLREIREERDRIAAQAERDRRRLEALERERAQWLQHQRQLQEAQQAPQRPDPINDPDGYAEWVESRLTQHERALQKKFSDDWVNLTFAQEHETNGEVFEKAMQALEQARSPQIVDEIRAAVNPGKALMRWYRRQTAITEVGDDIEGYQKRLRDQFKKDPEFRKEFMAELEAEARGGAPERSEPNVTSLPSLNRASGRAGQQRPGSLGGSDAEIFSSLTSGQR